MKTVCVVLLMICSVAFADEFTSYSGSYAASYAQRNYNKSYGSGTYQNPFGDFDGEVIGGNCTNFVSQCLIAGFIRSLDPRVVYSRRYDFDIDDSSTSIYQWYFHHYGDRGPAFTGAHKMFEYAEYNRLSYKGLHFEYITHDTVRDYLDVDKVRVGDVVFADWNGDEKMDHAMLVTGFNSRGQGYNKIRLTYQSENLSNRGLGDINREHRYKALFYVYRPLNYNPNGL